MKKDSAGAFYWIIELLRSKKVPFRISGGLAARAYGATRRLVDIDIEIPKKHFPVILKEAKPYLIFGPKRSRDEKWDVFLMTLRYRAQKIDLSATDNTKVFDIKRGK